jgi:threonine dehydrogenase-like Zn-dependent dehydrogenase
MKALCYAKPREFSVKEVPLPVVRDGDVLIKGDFH